MSIVRLAQFTGETRITTDFAVLGRGSFPTISSTRAKTGTYSYFNGLGQAAFGKAVPTSMNPATIRMGFWLNMNSSVLNSSTFLYHAGALTTDVTTYQIYLIYDSGTASFILRRPQNTSVFQDLTSFALPSQFGTTNSWFHVGITHFIDSSAGYLSVYIDGNRVLAYTGDTRPSRGLTGSTAGYADTFINILGPGTSTTSGTPGFTGVYIDDMYIDVTEGELDAPVPARRFLMAMPDGVGQDSGWTPDSGSNYTMVNDNPNDGDTTKVKALSTGLRDTYTYGNITVPADHRIVQVLPSPFAKRLDSALDNGLSVHAWDGAQYVDSDDIDLGMSYDIPAFGVLEHQPDGTDWNETDFNAMQFGIRSRGTF